MIGSTLRQLRMLWRTAGAIQHRLSDLEFSVGQLHAARVRRADGVTQLHDIEFRVWSQWGEDGILEYLLSRIPDAPPVFVEFGVEDYREANTRFLLRNRNWKGLVMDGSEANVARIRADRLYEHHDLQAVQAFITAENINELLVANGVSGDIGVLSIDLDGNDYWVWRAISGISPRVIVCEFNSVFGDSHAVTVPYDPTFDRRRAHHSKLFFGASLPALRELAESRGYTFVGCNTAGVNAFFVRQDNAAPFAELIRNARYVESRFRESVDERGRHTFATGAARLDVIAGCDVYDLRQQRIVRFRELMSSGSRRGAP